MAIAFIDFEAEIIAEFGNVIKGAFDAFAIWGIRSDALFIIDGILGYEFL